MRIIFFFIALPILFSSCKKETIEPSCVESNGGGLAPTAPPTPAQKFAPDTEGSYWIYEWYEIDSNGVETLYGDIDTVTITGDTIINGRKFTVEEGSYWVVPNTKIIRRDSSGYIINQYGDVIYSHTNFSDTISAGNNPTYWDWYIIMYDNQQVSVPAGVFTTIEQRRYHYDSLGGAITTCGDTIFTRSVWYAEGIGKVRETTGFWHSIKNCGNYPGANVEARLIEYYIAP